MGLVSSYSVGVLSQVSNLTIDAAYGGEFSEDSRAGEQAGFPCFYFNILP
jgi:hypothetical protein